MWENQSRRTWLRRATGTVLGVFGIGVVSRANAARASTLPNPGTPKWHESVVSDTRSGAVVISGRDQWLPLEGFPDGWQALVGDKIAVAPSTSGAGLSAQPLTHWVPAVAAPASLVPGARIGSAQGPVMDRATRLTEALSGERGRGTRTSRPILIAVADRTSSAGRAVAIREA